MLKNKKQNVADEKAATRVSVQSVYIRQQVKMRCHNNKCGIFDGFFRWLFHSGEKFDSIIQLS